MRKPVIVVLIVVAVAGGYALAVSTRASPSRELVRDTSRAAREEAIPRRTPAADEPVVDRAVATLPAATAAPTSGVTQPVSAAAEQDVEPPTDEERLAYADSVFDSQPFNGSWAPLSAQRLTTAAGQVATPEVRPGRAECRTNLCKLEVNTDSRRAGAAFVRPFMQASKWDGPIMVVRGEPDARGAQLMTFYFATSGTPLPEPPIVEP